MKKLFTLLFVSVTILCIGQTKQTTTSQTKPIPKTETIKKNGWEILSIDGFPYYAIFYDDFTSSKSASSWNLLHGESSTTIENNTLKFHLASIGRIRTPLIYWPIPYNSDFEIKTVVDIKSNALYEGIIFGFKDNVNYSSITFSAENKMLVYEKIENGITTEDDEAHNIYLVDYTDNEVRLIKKDGKMKVFFNGVEGYEIKNTKMSGNLVGLMAGGTVEMNEASFKSFYVEIGVQPSAGFENISKLNTIKVKSNNGVFSVPVELNGVLKMDFIFDSGASDISISPDIALTLIKAGTIKNEDWLPGAYYSFADGSTAKSERFKLHSVKIGNKVIKNATCSISNSINSPMLLGQSVLSKFGKYSFDNKQKILTIE